MATRNLHAPLLTVEDFLEIQFPSDTKFELDNGVIRMRAGGTLWHVEVLGNIASYMRSALRGSGCKPFSSDLGVRINNFTLRYPDIVILCGNRTHDRDEVAVTDPRMVVEVLSPTTRAIDLGPKLYEYQSLATLELILFVDPYTETTRLLSRNADGSWSDRDYERATDVPLQALNITLPHAEIFARD